MNQKQKKERMTEIVAALEQLYPEAVCALEYGGEPWRLLVMARLSAQCTDARVNLVCRDLFAAYPTPRALADAPLENIETIVRPCGLFHTKAQSIKEACGILCDRYGGSIPDTMEELLALPGVGRKIANLLLGDIFGKPAVVTDTHCIRICGRFGMYPTELKEPHKVEQILVRLIEPEKQSDFCHRVVQFGRDICTARAPKCDTCPLGALCEYKIRKKHKEKEKKSIDLPT
ncbi:MAG: endonuclease III [Ruminococcaceae bacterium]|nr:endonuclease III [Oscillospiraceae bacterium]